MRGRIEDKGKCGVYCIFNKITHKRYVGVSVDIYKRIITQRCGIVNKNTKRANRFLIEDWFKYGEDNFEYSILELLDNKNRTYLNERELFWMTLLDSRNPLKGYNLRADTSEGMLTHEITSEKCRNVQLNRYQDPNERLKTSISSKKFWSENPEIKDKMRKKLEIKQSKYKFLKFDKHTNEFICEYNTLSDIIKENPTYKKKHQIYAACSGEKPSIYGFKWKKILKDGKVQPSSKD